MKSLSDALFELWHAAQIAVCEAGGVHYPVKEIIPAPAFFPGGLGLFAASSVGSPLEVMIVGQDFGTVEYVERVHRLGAGEDRNSPTWRSLLSLLDEAGITAERCYFTNALLGLRPGSEMIGLAPGWKDPALVSASRQLLEAQISLLRPRAILTLGLPAARFLGGINPRLAPWASARSWADLDRAGPVFHSVTGLGSGQWAPAVGAILHPSLRGPNLHRRHYRGLFGGQAEKRILEEVLESAASS